MQPNEDEGVVAAGPDAQGEAAIELLEYEDVGLGVAAQPVPPELEGAQRFVQADVEDVVGLGRPGQSVAGLGHGLGGQRGVGVERGEAQLVLLVSAAVGRVGQPTVVVAHGGAPHGEVVRAGGQRVLVEQDLLLFARLAGGGQFSLAPGGPPAVDGVVLPFLGPGVVPPGPPPDRH